MSNIVLNDSGNINIQVNDKNTGIDTEQDQPVKYFNTILNTITNYSNKVYFHFDNIGINRFRIFHPVSRDYSISYNFVEESTVDDFYIKSDNNLVMYGKHVQYIDYSSTSATWINDNNIASYTLTEGDTITYNIKGTGFAFHHYNDNRGGIWRFTIESLDSTVDISTYSAVAKYTTSDVFSNLDYDSYEIIAEFIGDDPLNAPTGGTSRGWFSKITLALGENTTLYNQVGGSVYGSSTPNYFPDSGDYITDITLLTKSGIQAFALRVKKRNESSPNTWVPTHDGDRATSWGNLDNDRTLTIDGGSNLLSETSSNPSYAVGGTSITLHQRYKGIDSVLTSEELLQCESNTIFTKSGGYEIQNEVSILQDINMSLGYGSMFVLSNDEVELPDTLICEAGEFSIDDGDDSWQNVYSNATLPNYDGNCVIVNKVGLSDYAMAVNHSELNLMYDISDSTNQSLDILRGSSNRKLYPTVFSNQDLGTSLGTWSWRSSYIYGVVSDAYNTFINL